ARLSASRNGRRNANSNAVPTRICVSREIASRRRRESHHNAATPAIAHNETLMPGRPSTRISKSASTPRPSAQNSAASCIRVAFVSCVVIIHLPEQEKNAGDQTPAGSRDALFQSDNDRDHEGRAHGAGGQQQQRLRERAS